MSHVHPQPTQTTHLAMSTGKRSNAHLNTLDDIRNWADDVDWSWKKYLRPTNTPYEASFNASVASNEQIIDLSELPEYLHSSHENQDSGVMVLVHHLARVIVDENKEEYVV